MFFSFMNIYLYAGGLKDIIVSSLGNMEAINPILAQFIHASLHILLKQKKSSWLLIVLGHLMHM